MKKKISNLEKGQRADIGDLTIYRILPNRNSAAVGPFVFLDHIAPKVHLAHTNEKSRGTGEHPHRGIATLTYILHGEAEHFDSMGNNAIVKSGGIQWMKAGNGIIHDESLVPDPNDQQRLTHAFQFWINLPPKNKAESPQYIAVQADDVPKRILHSHAGWLKVIVGEYENLKSIIPGYSIQYIYHLHLEPGRQFSMNTKEGLEYAAFLPELGAMINGNNFSEGVLIEFERNEGEIEVTNTNETAMDILLFGGEPYSDPIVAQGPFVMNTQSEIPAAYNDYHAGKYGKINHALSN